MRREAPIDDRRTDPDQVSDAELGIATLLMGALVVLATIVVPMLF